MNSPSLLGVLSVIFLIGRTSTAPPKIIERGKSDDITNDKKNVANLIKSQTTTNEIDPTSNAIDPINGVVNRVLTSKTATAVDEAVSSMMTLAGGFVENVGDIVVESIDQLPETIKIVSNVVGTAFDMKREKVKILVKVLRPQVDHEKVMKGTVDRIHTAVENSKAQTGWETLERALASVIGKIIAMSYKNAQEINIAITNGLRRITDGGQDVNKTSKNEIKHRKL